MIKWNKVNKSDLKNNKSDLKNNEVCEIFGKYNDKIIYYILIIPWKSSIILTLKGYYTISETYIDFYCFDSKLEEVKNMAVVDLRKKKIKKLI